MTLAQQRGSACHVWRRHRGAAQLAPFEPGARGGGDDVAPRRRQIGFELRAAAGRAARREPRELIIAVGGTGYGIAGRELDAEIGRAQRLDQPRRVGAADHEARQGKFFSGQPDAAHDERGVRGGVVVGEDGKPAGLLEVGVLGFKRAATARNQNHMAAHLVSVHQIRAGAIVELALDQLTVVIKRR